MTKPTHIPVMAQEILSHLHLKNGMAVVDATLGLGGHAAQIIHLIGPQGKLLGIERSIEGLELAKANLNKWKGQIIFHVGDFRDIAEIVRHYNFDPVNGIFFDLGLASWQIDTGYKGLSFQRNEPLDMVLTEPTATWEPSWTDNFKLQAIVKQWRFVPVAKFLNRAKEQEIAIVLRELSELTGAHKLATMIIEARKHGLATTGDLVKALTIKNPGKLAQLFQGLRILANDEYGSLVQGLKGAWQILSGKGNLAVITFQSAEDRIVKQVMRQLQPASKPLRVFPSREEIKNNSRARSAILRIVSKLKA